MSIIDEKKIPCTVEILTRNSAATLERCLESVRDFAEIIILDGNSTDETRYIAARFGARIFPQYDTAEPNVPIRDYSEVRNKGLHLATFGWFMYIDSDEYLSREAIAEIKEVVIQADPEVKVYWQTRKYVLGGDIIERATTYPNRQIRLFHKDAVREFIKPIHERIEVKPGMAAGILSGVEYVPLDSLSLLSERWERQFGDERKDLFAVSRQKLFKKALHRAGLLGLYSVRFLRILFFGRGRRMPFHYEWRRHIYDFRYLVAVTRAMIWHVSYPSRIIYISHWRFPSEKTMSPLVMKECEMFARAGIPVELWVPWRNNKGFSGTDPFSYHGIERSFFIRRFFAADFTGIFHGNFFFLLMVASFLISVFWYVELRKFRHGTIFYFHDARDAFFFPFLRKSFYLEIHDFYKSYMQWINNAVFSRAEGLMVTNTVKITSLNQEFHIPDFRMLYCPNGVDIGLFGSEISRDEARAKLNLPQDGVIILYAGHLFDWKGADTLLHAYKFLTDREKIYFVGGTDKDIESFQAKSAALNAQNVVVVGRRPHEEIPLWLRAADVLVLPSPAVFEASRVETSPVKLFEYMASARPVVASDVPSIRDVADESLLFFAKPDDPQSFAEIIHFVMENPKEAEARSIRAKERVKEFSWEVRTRRVIDFIRRTSSV